MLRCSAGNNDAAAVLRIVGEMNTPTLVHRHGDDIEESRALPAGDRRQDENDAGLHKDGA